MTPPEPDPPEPVDDTIYLDIANFVRYDNIGQDVIGATPLNIYSKLTYKGVEYSLTSPNYATPAFAFDRTIGSSEDSYLGFCSNSSTPYNWCVDVYGDEKHQYVNSWNVYDGTVYPVTVTPVNAELQSALGGKTNFNVVYRS